LGRNSTSGDTFAEPIHFILSPSSVAMTTTPSKHADSVSSRDPAPLFFVTSSQYYPAELPLVTRKILFKPVENFAEELTAAHYYVELILVAQVKDCNK
jgi:hypothetical protein